MDVYNHMHKDRLYEHDSRRVIIVGDWGASHLIYRNHLD